MADFIEIDASDVTTFLKINLGEKLPKGYNTRKVVSDIAEIVRTRIRTRTKAGFDISLQPFVNYSAIHARNRKRAGLQIEHVDLYFTGKMQGAIAINMISDFEAVINIPEGREELKGLRHQRGGKSYIDGKEIFLPARPWFGLSSRDTATIKNIEKVANDELDKTIKNI